MLFFKQVSINDIFADAATDQIIAGMKEVAARIHDQNLRVFIGTITPFDKSPYHSIEREQIRQEVNKWIRSNEIFDGVIDFDQVLADPQMPDQLLPAYDSGDHFHPNDEGYKALADSVPISLFFK